MKLCTNCKFCMTQKTGQGWFYGCKHKPVYTTSLVTGQDILRYYTGCEKMRAEIGDCKEAGLLFEQKTT